MDALGSVHLRDSSAQMYECLVVTSLTKSEPSIGADFFAAATASVSESSVVTQARMAPRERR